jgi:hypothetical protein
MNVVAAEGKGLRPCSIAVRLGSAVPKGLSSVARAGAGVGITNGGSCVTPKGPLTPLPAPGEKYVKYSPRL